MWGLKQRMKAQILGGERGGDGRVSVYTREMVREGWRKLGGRRKSTRVTLAMRNTLSA